MIERKAYICEYCNKHRKHKKRAYLSEEACRSHEYDCCYNPKFRGCLTCKHNSFENSKNRCAIGKNERETLTLHYEKPYWKTIMNCDFWESKEVTNEHI